ncbi:hypothetical protein QBC47DRAFT_223578 [Echria macrotheca]|uniref:Uncharacterized protein n=1 Tax=Echria macrotheca TaxID=438768 RepID=A0AAJ0BAF7_9PEZI|nr:hypothetical protein QBC47DRAFT_223578 [Echria macrotheca]
MQDCETSQKPFILERVLSGLDWGTGGRFDLVTPHTFLFPFLPLFFLPYPPSTYPEDISLTIMPPLLWHGCALCCVVLCCVVLCCVVEMISAM